VGVQTKEPRRVKHEGCVHATSLEMALIFAKEQYSRRGMCSGLWVTATKDIIVTDYTDNATDVYNQFDTLNNCTGKEYSIFHMFKRGIQHSFAGTVNADTPQNALSCSKGLIERKKPVLNAWLVETSLVLKTTDDDMVIWNTTPEKLFREAIDYKTAEKLKSFKDKQ